MDHPTVTIHSDFHRWPLEESLSLRAMGHVETALRDWLATHDYDAEIHNTANAIRSRLQKEPTDDELLA